MGRQLRWGREAGLGGGAGSSQDGWGRMWDRTMVQEPEHPTQHRNLVTWTSASGSREIRKKEIPRCLH